MAKRISLWMMTAMLICGTMAFVACSSDDDEKKVENLTAEMLTGLWVMDYEESGSSGDVTWTRTVEGYQFNADGTGYYECYQLDGEDFVKATAIRDNDSLHFTIDGYTVTITGDKNNMKQTLAYTDGRLTVQGKVIKKATAEQQTLVDQLYAEWSGANSSGDEIGYIECSWNGTEVVKTPKAVKAQDMRSLPHGNMGGIAGRMFISGYCDDLSWIYVEENSTLDIILCDDAELKLYYIELNEGATLRIFGQEKGTGKLIVKPGDYFAKGKPAIGQELYESGSIEIHGGNIVAEGYYGSAIGNGYYWNSIGSNTNSCIDKITIYGGTINAIGGEKAAAIGSCEGTPNATGIINIYGGTIIAQGGKYAAGIGGGIKNRMNQINIHGGEVYAYAGADGAGIGGGEGGESGDILITGGTVRAYGDRTYTGSSNKGYGAGIGSGQSASVNTIIIKGGDIAAYGGEDGAGIGTGEEYGSDIISGTIEIHGGKVWAEGKGYGAGIGAGEDATFGVLGISGGRVDAHAGSDCGPWSGGIGAYHSEHEDGCHIGWAGWQRIYIGAGMRLWTYSPNVGYIENVNTAGNQWWDFVHQRPQVAFGVCDHEGWAVCPLCYPYTIQLGGQ